MEMKRFLKVAVITFALGIFLAAFNDFENGEGVILFLVLMLYVDRFIISGEKQGITVKSVEVEMDLDDVDDMMKQLSKRMEEREAVMRKGERVITKDKAP